MKNIFLSVSHGFQLRNFLQTPFIYELSSKYKVIVLIDQKNLSYLSEYVKSNELPISSVIGVSINEKKYEGILDLLRKNVFVNPKRVNTKNIMNEINRQSMGKWGVILKILNYIFGSIEIFRKIWRGIENFLISGKEFNPFFDEFSPEKVITADYGTRPFEIRLLRCSRRRSVQSISIVPSWDNLTSKGVIGVRPNYLALWNEVMLKEAVQLHSFKKETLRITGPLQFDNFFQKDFCLSKESFCTKYDIDSNQPVIIYGTVTPKFFRYNFDILNILNDLINDGSIGGNPKVIVRVHPQVVSDPLFGDNIESYQDFSRNNSNFSLSIPKVHAWSSIQVPDPEDYRDLVSMLKYSNVCIASASTLIFDAFASGIPFIGIGFDGYESNIDPRRSVGRMFDYDHYSNINKLGGFAISRSINEFQQDIVEALNDSDIYREGRDKILNRQIKFLDGLNYKRTIDFICSV